MALDLLVLLLGLACAAGGGESFVRGAVGLATAARVPPGVVGATVAAFATSSPELAVAIGSGLEGRPELALGDALGSNVANVGLVLGLTVLVGSVRVGGGTVSRDLAAAIVIPLLTLALAADGALARLDAVLLLAAFAGWLLAVLVEAWRERSAVDEVLGAHGLGRALLVSAVGVALLVVAGRLVVVSATSLGESLGLGTFVVGVVIVALGTSTPELATAVIARLRGHSEIGLGTVLGSNVYNGAVIIPVAALLAPISFDVSEIAVSIAFGLLVVAVITPIFGSVLGRRRGALLVTLYAASLVALVLLGH